MTPRPLQVPPNCDLTLGLVCIDKTVPGRTVWQMDAHERFANPAGTMQGGFIAACCDSAMGASAVTFAAGRRVWVANAELKVSLLRPVPIGSRLVCEAMVVGGGSRVAFVEATVSIAGDPTSPPGSTAPPASPVARASSTYLLTERDAHDAEA